MSKNTKTKVQKYGYWEMIRIIKTSVYESKQEFCSGLWKEKRPDNRSVPAFHVDELKNITDIILW